MSAQLRDEDDGGHYVRYEDLKFRPDSLAMIKQANEIIGEYQKYGMAISLRQLYYQFVSRDLFANVIENYNKLGDVISRGRIAGLVSWTAIEDRGRNLMGLSTFDSPQQAIRGTLANYRTDLWADQPMRPEVWVEKAALEGVIGQVCNELRVDFFATRGYNSQSEQWRAGRRLASYIAKGQMPIVFHLGDHDPSGIDMTRDNRDRLSMFAGTPINVQRLALNMNQIEQYRPPPNPAKMTDVRAPDYVAKFGNQSWELDALDPAVIRNLIHDAVMRIRDPQKWDAALKLEAEDRITLQEFADEAGQDDEA